MVIYCNKCGAENPDDSKYCGSCGALIKDYSRDKVEETPIKEQDIEEKQTKPIETAITTTKKEPSKLLKYSSYVVIVIAIIMLIAIPIRTTTSTSQQAYTDYENYIVQEPYLATETYEEQEPFIDENCDYIDSSAIDFTSVGQNLNSDYYSTMLKVGCMITNNEDYSVTYDYNIVADKRTSLSEYSSNELVPEYKYTFSKKGSITLSPKSATSIGELSETFSIEVSKTGAFWNCFVKPRDISECNSFTNYRTVQKEKSVTKYKDVTQRRPVTKYRTITTYKQVNWLLGISFPWHNSWEK